jgi:peptidoglycan/LPS O-acetylase OafA/YrhL
MASAPAAGTRLRHEPALDGLRGLAVIAVLAFHGGHLRGGYLGVDAFFVLSGFLITSLLLAEARATGGIALGAFWSRRARRLLPALACVIGAVAFYAAWIAQPEELAAIRGDALATLGYVANWRAMFTHNDYWAMFRSPSPLEHTWSLAIEEQFYVIWPLVVVALLRGRDASQAARRVLIGSLMLAALSFAYMQLLYNASNPSMAYYSTVTRMASILLGAALASWLARFPRAAASKARGRGVGRCALEICALVAAAALACAWTRLDGASTALYRGGLLVCAIATTTVIAAAVHPRRGPISRALSFRPLCALGLISYGLYLWHWPIYVYLDSDRVHLSGWPLLAVRVGVTLAVAVASYRFVEQPIRVGAGAPGRIRRLAPALAAALVLAVFVSTNGAPTAPAAAATNVRGGILIVGDSVAGSLRPGLDHLGPPVAESWSPGCRLISGGLRFKTLFTHDCTWRQDWSAKVRQQRPDTVVLLPGIWDLFDVKPPNAASYLMPGTDRWARTYAAALDSAISVLGSTGAQIVLPTMPCVGAVPGAKDGVGSALDLARVRAANEVVTRVAAQHPSSVSVPDLFTFLCPGSTYEEGVNGVASARSDGEHFTPEGADAVAQFLRPYIVSTNTNTNTSR